MTGRQAAPERAGPRARWGWLLALLLAVPAAAPLAYPGNFQTQSGFLPALNAVHLEEAPDWGRLPGAIWGEGRLPYILVQPFYRLSGSGTVAVRWGFGLAFLLGAVGVFAWLCRRLGVRGAVLAAAVYTYLPWHLGTVYVRGAFGEAWLWALWPLALWAVDRLDGRRPALAAAAGVAALAATFWVQAGLSALFLWVVAVYAAWRLPRREHAVWVGASVAAGAAALVLLGRSAPAAGQPAAEGPLYPYQLFSAAWGAAPAPALSEGNLATWSRAPEPTFQLGLAAVGLAIVAVALAASARPRGGRARDGGRDGVVEGTDAVVAPAAGAGPGGAGREGAAPARAGAVDDLWFWSAVLVAVALLTLKPAGWLWEAAGWERLVARPWQVLALAGLPLAYLAGSVVRLERQLAELPAWAGLVALAVLASYPYLAPRFTQADPGRRPAAMFQSAANVAPEIMLVDAGIEPAEEITDTLTVTLTWQSLAPVPGDYTVFVHLLAGDDKVAQQDARPCRGECATTDWRPGDLVIDPIALELPAGTPPGPYRLAVGLYQLESGERALVTGRDDRTVYLDVP